MDALLKYGELHRKDSENSGFSLFGEAEEMKPERPEIPAMTGEEDILEKLHLEKELVGMYLSSHPLDKYRFELENLASIQMAEIDAAVAECEENKEKRKVTAAGFITSTQTLIGKTGKPWSKTVVEDYSGSYELAFFGKDHENFMSYLQTNMKLAMDSSDGAVAGLVYDGCVMGMKNLHKYKNEYIGASATATGLCDRAISLEAGLSEDMKRYL